MFAPQCLFCDHVNPAGAKFCNDCGSPLQVKRCSRCEAVNDQAAKNCSKCGTEFPVLSTRAEAPPMSSGRDVTAASPALRDPLPFRLDFDRAFDSPRSTFEDPTPPVFVGSDRGHTPEPESVADIQNLSARSPGNETAGRREPGPEIVTREPRSLGTAETSLLSAAGDATAKVLLRNRDATAELRPMSRVALAVSLPALVLIAIGIFAYYVYSHSVQVSERQGGAATADVNASGPATQPIPKIGITASSAPPASIGTGSAAAFETAKPAPPVEPSAAAANSPVSQGTAAATGSKGAAGQTPSPNEPHRQAPTSDHVSPAQQFVTKAEGVSKMPSAATADTAGLRDRTTLATPNEVTAKHSTTNRPMRVYPAASAARSVQSSLSDGRANIRPDVPRPGTCTEGVAALGLCSLSSPGESK